MAGLQARQSASARLSSAARMVQGLVWSYLRPVTSSIRTPEHSGQIADVIASRAS